LAEITHTPATRKLDFCVQQAFYKDAALGAEQAALALDLMAFTIARNIKYLIYLDVACRPDGVAEQLGYVHIHSASPPSILL
jgi:hypothetical protein